MMADLFAHARRTDPDTSHEAAEAVTPDLRELQRRVEAYALRKGAAGFVDAEMEEEMGDGGSTYRTRRSELTARNIILDTGGRGRWGDSPRRRIIWAHRNYIPGAPPVSEPAQPLGKDDRAKAAAHAATMESAARQMRSEGRTLFAQSLDECAAFLRGLR